MLKFSTISAMSTVNYSVPEDIKRAFNETFAGRNKSAIVAELMAEAVERERLRQRRAETAQRILDRRGSGSRASAERVRRAREQGRP